MAPKYAAMPRCSISKTRSRSTRRTRILSRARRSQRRRQMQEPVFQHSCLQPLVDHPSDNTVRLLSALELLPYALASSSRPVGILTFDKRLTEQMLADHPDASRLRIVGLSDQANWSNFWAPDWYAKKLRASTDALRRELLEVCLRERQTGAFTEIVSLVLECTAMPQFRADIVAAIRVPTWDIAAFAKKPAWCLAQRETMNRADVRERARKPPRRPSRSRASP